MDLFAQMISNLLECLVQELLRNMKGSIWSCLTKSDASLSVYAYLSFLSDCRCQHKSAYVGLSSGTAAT